MRGYMDLRQTGEKVRRHSRAAGRCEATFWRPFEKSDKGRFMLAAERFERSTRLRGKRYGRIGSVGMEVLRELLRLVDFKTGRLEPSISYLQSQLKRSRAAVVRALAMLKGAGFLDWLRRYEPTGLPQGPRVKQATNAYRLSLPPAAERLLGALRTAAPLSADQEHHYAAAAALRAEGAFNDTPLGQAMERLGRSRQQRESAGRSESGIMIFQKGVTS